MLASITPLGERGRRSDWWLTVSAFLLGATAAGAAAGALLGALGAVALPAHRPVAVLLVAIAVAIVLDGLPSTGFPGLGDRSTSDGSTSTGAGCTAPATAHSSGSA